MYKDKKTRMSCSSASLKVVGTFLDKNSVIQSFTILFSVLILKKYFPCSQQTLSQFFFQKQLVSFFHGNHLQTFIIQMGGESPKVVLSRKDVSWGEVGHLIVVDNGFYTRCILYDVRIRGGQDLGSNKGGNLCWH